MNDCSSQIVLWWLYVTSMIVFSCQHCGDQAAHAPVRSETPGLPVFLLLSPCVSVPLEHCSQGRSSSSQIAVIPWRRGVVLGLCCLQEPGAVLSYSVCIRTKQCCCWLADRLGAFPWETDVCWSSGRLPSWHCFHSDPPLKSCGEDCRGNCQFMSLLCEEDWVEMTHLSAVGHCSLDCSCASDPRRVHLRIAWSNRSSGTTVKQPITFLTCIFTTVCAFSVHKLSSKNISGFCLHRTTSVTGKLQFTGAALYN